MSDSAIRPISDEEWEDLVRQLHNQSPARPRPFFYTRLQARIAANALVKNQGCLTILMECPEWP